MDHPGRFWLGTAIILGAYDIWCARNDVTGDTASECLRAAFRIHTPAGEVAFTGALVASAIVFHRHICR